MTDRGSDSAMAPGFVAHLVDAIEINRQRKPIYAAKSAGRSTALSNRLIRTERLALPLAWYVDWRARPFQRRSIPIIAADFVSMEAIRSVSEPPRFRGSISVAAARSLRVRLGRYGADLSTAVRDAHFTDAAHLTRALIEEVAACEVDCRSHLCMTVHVLESIGWACLNAVRFRDMSEGDTVGLSRAFIRIQALALREVVSFDQMAQPLHAEGIGILVNDVPPIPFMETPCG